ncbi:DUF1002 domain-containing protein [Cytobacillus sp. S13-E01]|uniref:DUF1002 domain-containing protein n=1 Tax=Cytobacillus sp. S13-E01 TaxID=3031326 RepID=UPI0023D7CB8E|nr:DUF1002 domain-containing protein [Cytobacillus sp. S13-E01]MDF0726153.1 DUF1002 domain-containing protein [Cytobacillus sp. S13-E01]
MLKRNWVFSLFLVFTLIIPSMAFADAAEGDVIITLGEDLKDVEKQKLLKEMNAPENPQIVTVSNEEEHKYLGQYIPKATIGTRALSSSAITIGAPESGLEIVTNNITSITDDMFTNALITAGVKDASIYITAPIPVSGTAALTGIIKAYELSSDQVIPEEVKQIANEEMVKTVELGDSIGAEKAAALIAKIKDEIAKNAPQTDEELRAIIQTAANELGITLTEDQINSLVSFFNKMKDLNIDWNQVNEQLNLAKEKLTNFLESEEGQTFLTKLQDFLVSLIDALKALFS